MTPEQRIEIFKKVLFPPLFPSDVEPPLDTEGNVANLQNYDTIHQLISGREFTEKGLYEAIMTLRAQNMLVMKIGTGTPQPEPENPADNLPCDDGSFPELANIRTMIDVQNLSAADGRRFLQPGAPKKEFEERIAFIREHQIFESTKPYTKSKTQSKTSEDGPVQMARRLISDLKISDIGTTTSAAGGGKWTQLHKTQNRLNSVIDSAVKRKVEPEQILAHVEEEIKKLGSRSIG